MTSKPRVAWLTADCFVDVDLPIVPALRDSYEIDWHVLVGANSGILVPDLSGIPDTTVHRLRFRQSDPRILLEYWRILRTMKSRSPELVYLSLVGIPYFHLLPLLFWSVRRMVCATHNVEDYAGWSNRFWMKNYLGFIFRTYRNFHLFSRHTFERFKILHPRRRAFLALLGLKDYGPSSVVRESDRTKFLFFGNVRANKNLGALLEAFAALPASHRDRATLSVKGACPPADRDSYRRLVVGDSRVTLDFRMIPDGEIPDLFSSHHFLLLPYTHVAQSGPHMIAYNYGLPVIATNIDGFSERIRDGVDGYLLESPDREGLVRGLVRAIDGMGGYPVLVNNLKHQVDETYSPRVVARKYGDMFEKILSR